MEPNITTKHKPMKDKISMSEHGGGAAAISGGTTKKGCGGGGGGGPSSMKTCQADKCSVDLNDAKTYHRRHKVCEQHAKAQVVVVAGIRQRFCQQCSRFHELLEFDESKRSCRRRLAGHNERRRKNPMDNTTQSEGSSTRIKVNGQLKEIVCAQVEDRRRVQENGNYKHFNVI